MSGAGGDGGKETETEDDGGEDHMEEEARKKKRGRPPKATAEGDEKKRGGKWVVWYDVDGNEVDRKVKVGCCVAVARLSAVMQSSRLNPAATEIACTCCRFHASLMLCCACSPCS